MTVRIARATRTASPASPFAFAYTGHTTFAERVNAGHAFAGDVLRARGSLAGLFLNVAVFIAATAPDQSPTSVAVMTLDTLAKGKPEIAKLLGEYKSHAQNAIKVLRERPDFPAFDASVSETARLRKVDAYAKRFSLRALSDSVTTLRAENAATARDVKASEAKASEAKARADVGATGDTLAGMSMLRLMEEVSKWQDAALKGDANARVILARLITDLMITRDQWNAADDAAATPVQVRIAV